MAQDTRKDPRARVLQMTVRYKSATVDEFIEHHSHDVSRGGIFIKTPSPFPAGTLLKFEIRLQDEQTVIAGVGRVVWKREPAQASDTQPAGMGVKFIKIDEKSKAVITRLVEAQQGAGSAFEAGITERSDAGEAEAPPGGSGHTSSPPAETAAPAPAAKAGAPQVRRASTMLGLGSIGAKGGPAAGKAEPKKDEPEGGTFFPATNPEKEMPPPEERTMMKQAAELLKQALAEAGESLDEIGAPKEPLTVAAPKKVEARAEPPRKVDARAEPALEPALEPRAAAPEPVNERRGRDEPPPLEPQPGRISGAASPADDAAVAEHDRAARQDAKTVDERPKAKPAATTTPRPKDEKPAAAKSATKTPLAQEEESSGTGRLLTILLVAAALGGALWLFFGQSDTKPATNTPAPEPPAAKPEAAPEEKPQPKEVVPAATEATAPGGEEAAPPASAAAPAASTGGAAAPAAKMAEPSKAAAEPEAPKPAEEPAAAKPTEEPAAAKPAEEPAAAKPVEEPAAAKPAEEPAAATPKDEPAAPATAAPKPKPKPAPRPAAPKPSKSEDPYG